MGPLVQTGGALPTIESDSEGSGGPSSPASRAGPISDGVSELVSDGVGRGSNEDIQFRLLFSKEIVEGLAGIIWPLSRTMAPVVQGNVPVGLKEVAKIGAVLLPDILCLGLGALTALARIEKAAIPAAVQVASTVGTLVRAGNLPEQQHFPSTVVTDHNLPALGKRPRSRRFPGKRPEQTTRFGSP